MLELRVAIVTLLLPRSKPTILTELVNGVIGQQATTPSIFLQTLKPSRFFPSGAFVQR